MYNMWATTITKLKFSLTNITAQPHAICSTFQGHNARDHSLATDLKYSITNTASYTAHNKDPRIFIEVFFFPFITCLISLRAPRLITQNQSHLRGFEHKTLEESKLLNL